jgi:hypothetical protein
MSGGGSTSKDESKTTTSIDPQLKTMFTQNYDSGMGVANREYQGFGGQRVADPNANQVAAWGAASNLGNVGNANMQNATSAAQGAASYSPLQIGGNYSPERVSGQTLAETDLQPYMNPFQQSVIDSTMKTLEEQRGRSMVGNAQGATAATGGNPFYGDRIGVQNALTNEYFGNTARDTVSGLNLQNFNQAQNAAVGDISRGIDLGKFNSGMGLEAAGLNQNAELANQQAGLTGSALNLSGANTLAGLSSQELQQALTKAGAQEAAGTAQFGIDQMKNDADYDSYMQEWMYPLLQQQVRNEAMGLMPVTGTTNSSGSSEVKKQMGIGDWMSGIGGLMGGVGAMGSGGIFGSDIRLKENIVPIETDENGVNWYDFNYIGHKETHRGVMAQELEQIRPDAVFTGPLGYKLVNYGVI